MINCMEGVALEERLDLNIQDVTLNKKVDDIRFDDELQREQLIEDYIPFIIKVVSKVTGGKYIDIKNSDEFSIGLSAFNEAIDCFNIEKQKSFLRFSEQVIKRRLIDYIRKNKKYRNVYPFTYFNDIDDEGNEEEFLGERYQVTYLGGKHENNLEQFETNAEILTLRENLAKFGITLETLVECSPKHKDSKKSAIKVAKILSEQDNLFQELCRNKRIPMGELLKAIDVTKRTIERNRKFIIAVSLILRSDLSIVKDYVKNIEEE